MSKTVFTLGVRPEPSTCGESYIKGTMKQHKATEACPHGFVWIDHVAVE